MTDERTVPTITVSSVLADLKNGLTRDDIAVKYDLPKSQIKLMFQHEQLKNKKTIKPKAEQAPRFILIDDVSGETPQAEEQPVPSEPEQEEVQDTPEPPVQENQDSTWN